MQLGSETNKKPVESLNEIYSLTSINVCDDFKQIGEWMCKE